MKVFLLILLCAFAAFGQDIEATTADGKIVVLKKNGTWKYKTTRPTYTTPRGWKLLVETESSLDGLIYYYKDITEGYSTLEGWIRAEPMFIENYKKKNKLPANFAYYLDYLRLDCKGKRISIEKRMPYSTGDRIINTKKNYLSSFYEPVVPDSVGEEMWEKLCRAFGKL